MGTRPCIPAPVDSISTDGLQAPTGAAGLRAGHSAECSQQWCGAGIFPARFRSSFKPPRNARLCACCEERGTLHHGTAAGAASYLQVVLERAAIHGWEEKERWVLCLLLANAGGGASKGSKSLAREEGPCPPPTAAKAGLPQGAFPGLHAFSEGVFVDTAWCSPCQAAQRRLRRAMPVAGQTGPGWQPPPARALQVPPRCPLAAPPRSWSPSWPQGAGGGPSAPPGSAPRDPHRPALPRTGLRPSASALPLEPCS